MELYTHGQMKSKPIYGQILYNCGLSSVFKSKLRNNVKLFSVEITIATSKESVELAMGLLKEILTVQLGAKQARLIIIIHRL